MNLFKASSGFILGLILFVAIFHQTPSFSFVWDDRSLVENKAFAQPLGSGLKLSQGEQLDPEVHTKAAVRVAHDSLRPLLFLQFWIEQKIFGWNAGISHLISLAISLLLLSFACVLFYFLTHNLKATSIFAIMIASHPFLVEPTVYISARSDLLTTILSILATLLFLVFVRKKKLYCLFLSCICFLIGMGFKENIILLPIILFFLFYPRGAQKLAIQAFLAFGVSLAAYLLWRTNAAQTANSSDVISSIRQLPNDWLHYALLFVVPYEISTARAPLSLWFLTGWIVFGLIIIFLALRRQIAMLLALLASIVVLWPSAIGIEVYDIAADRYFLPSMLVLSGIMAVIIEKAYVQKPRLTATALFILVATWFAASLNSVGAWQNNFTLFSHAVASSGTASAYYRLSTEVGDTEALPLLEQAHQLDPTHEKVINNLGVLYMRNGNINRAEEILLSASKADSTNPKIWFNLGIISLGKGNRTNACEFFQEAIKLNPHYSQAIAELKKWCQ